MTDNGFFPYIFTNKELISKPSEIHREKLYRIYRIVYFRCCYNMYNFIIE